MALTLGTNCGFVTAAPVDDPAATNIATDVWSRVTKHALPADAATITEIGWYCDNATEEANFIVGLYDDNGVVVPWEAGARLFVSGTVAKGTAAGWKSATGLNWDVAAYAGTNLWIGFSLADTATTTNGNYVTPGGSGLDQINSYALNDPYGGGALAGATAVAAIYAVYEVAAGGTLSLKQPFSRPFSGALRGF